MCFCIDRMKSMEERLNPQEEGAKRQKIKEASEGIWNGYKHQYRNQSEAERGLLLEKKDLETMPLRHILMREMHRCFFKLKVPCPFSYAVFLNNYVQAEEKGDEGKIHRKCVTSLGCMKGLYLFQ